MALEVDTIETAKRMVDRGLGVAFLPQLAVAQELRSRKLVTVKLLDAEHLGRSLDVLGGGLAGSAVLNQKRGNLTSRTFEPATSSHSTAKGRIG